MKEFIMKVLFKLVTAAALTGAMALATLTPGQAREGRDAGAAIGFGAGAVVGAAAASAHNGRYYGDPGYAYGPGYNDDYAYEPAPVYVDPGEGQYYSYNQYKRGNLNGCTSSPASHSFGASC